MLLGRVRIGIPVGGYLCVVCRVRLYALRFVTYRTSALSFVD